MWEEGVGDQGKEVQKGILPAGMFVPLRNTGYNINIRWEHTNLLMINYQESKLYKKAWKKAIREC